MKKFLLLLTLPLFSLLPLFATVSLSGSGTASDPYTISSMNEWINFAGDVNHGETYEGKYIVLNKDITVSDSNYKDQNYDADSDPNPIYVGTFYYYNYTRGTYITSNSYNRSALITRARPFKGIFNGQGYTINFTMSYSSGTPFRAPFKCVQDAVITNLNVGGTANCGLGSSSLVALSIGNTVISNCRSSATLEFTGQHSGSLVGTVMTGNLLLKNCLYDGSISKLYSETSGLVGWARPNTGAHVTCENCYFNPSSTPYDKDCFTLVGHTDGAVNRVTIKNSYYSAKIGMYENHNQGTFANSGMCALLGDGWVSSGEKAIPNNRSKNLANAVIIGLDHVYDSGSTPSSDSITVIADKILTASSDYTSSSSSATRFNACPATRVTATGQGSYSGSVSFDYYVADEVFESSDEDLNKDRYGSNPEFKYKICGFKKSGEIYLIETPEDLVNLSRYVNADSGNSCSGKTFRLEYDLDFGGEVEGFNTYNYTSIGFPSITLGSDASCKAGVFAGTFEGNNKTIKGITSLASDKWGGLFAALNGGTIQNLHVKDSRFNFRGDSNGVICGMNGGSWSYTYYSNGAKSATNIINGGTISNCHVHESVYVYTNEKSTNKCGGIVGYLAGTVKSCSSAVHLLTSNSFGNTLTETDYYGGIVGNNEGTVTNCFYYGDDIQAKYCKGSISGNDGGSFSNNLHINNKLAAVGYYDNGNASSKNISGAGFGYRVYPENDFIKITIPDSSSASVYDVFTAIDGMFIFNGVHYMASGKEISFSIDYSGSVAPERLTFGYTYGTNYKDITSNSNGTYTITLPENDVTICAGCKYEGSGNEDDPYIITIIEEFNLFIRRINGGTTDFDSKFIELKNDLDYGNIENAYSVAGCLVEDRERPFKGSFDGKGNSIRGINITKSSSSDSTGYAGLFGILYGTVKNLTLEDFSIACRSYVGAIAGKNNGLIENCQIGGSDNNSQIKAFVNAGGVAGINNGTIKNCRVESSLSLSSLTTDSSILGGIAGCNKGNIEGCFSASSVKASSYVGGIAGINSASLIHCLFREESENSIQASSYKGTIIGCNDENAVLTGNFSIGSAEKSVGKAYGSEDMAGAVTGYRIISSKYNLNPSVITGDVSTYDYDKSLLTFADSDSESDIALVYDSLVYCCPEKTITFTLDSTVLPSTAILQTKTSAGYTSLEADSQGNYSITMPYSNVDFEAFVELTFDSNEGSAVSSQRIVYGEAAAEPASPVKNGWAFEGWYSDQNFSQKFDFSTSLTSNLTLYAKYVGGTSFTAGEDSYSPGHYYATFYNSKYNYKIDDKSSIWYVAKKEDGSLALEKDDGKIINKGNAVILQSTSPSINLYYTEESSSSHYENLLSGTDAEIAAAEEGTYVLSIGKKGGVGFYKWTGKISANRAFLRMETSDE
ncbi:MAG: InlB B-repeat-containing protein [Treponema sp.]|nr:InlB B-repeat-containing protein [Treponema sp.]